MSVKTLFRVQHLVDDKWFTLFETCEYGFALEQVELRSFHSNESLRILCVVTSESEILKICQ